MFKLPPVLRSHRLAMALGAALALVVSVVLLALMVPGVSAPVVPSVEPIATIDPAVVEANANATLQAGLGNGEGSDGDRPAPPKTTEPSIADVELGQGVSESELASLASQLGLTVRHYLPQIGYASVESLDGLPIPAATLARLTSSGLAKVAEPTGWAQVASAVPSDPRYAEQWGFNNTGQTGGVSGADMAAEEAWDWSRGDDVVVAVIDEGVMTTHPDLASQMWVNDDEIAGNGIDDDGNGYVDDINGWDFYNDNASVYDSVDGDMHGTHVAGTIAAATNNSVGGAGTAWNSKIMAVKGLGPLGGAYADLAAAIVYAVDNGAKISNNSWGGPYADGSIAAAVSYAESQGHLMLCAAGNNADNADSTPFYPAAYTNSNIISVAAHDASDNLSSFSNYGATSVDLAAPGTAILSTRAASTAGVRVMNRTAAGGTAPYSMYYYSFPVERLGGAGQTTTRNTLLNTAITTLAPNTATSVLVVNDSWNLYGDVTSVYTDRLAALGYTNVTTKVTWSGTTAVTPSTAGYGLVIWFTDLASVDVGGSTKMTLTAAERTEMGNYLKAGGKMLLVSAELAKDVKTYSPTSGLPWAVEFTRARLFADTHQNYFAGVSGGQFNGLSGMTPDWLTAGASYPPDYLSFVAGDSLAPQSGAERLLYWTSQYFSINGTSMATPHVAGAAALAWARTPDATMAEVRSRILSTTSPVAALSGKMTTGGRLNAAAAVGQLLAPSDLSASATGSDSMAVNWLNDTTDAYFSATKVLARFGEPVAGSEDTSATLVYEGSGTAASLTGVESGTWHLAAYSVNDFGMWSEDATAAVVLSALTETPEGELEGDIVVTFPSWDSTGTVTALPLTNPPAAPAGKQIAAGLGFDIQTSVGFTGPSTITLYYGDSAEALAKESSVRLYHYVGGSWVDITTSKDVSAKTVTGVTSSFSPFAVMVTADVQVVSTPAADPWALSMMVVAGLLASRWSVRRGRATRHV